MANPFAINQNVRPLGISRGQYAPVKFIGEQRQAEAEAAAKAEQAQAFQIMQQDFNQALKSENPDDMAKFSMKYPSMAKTAQEAFGFTDDKTKEASQLIFGKAISANNEEQAAQYLLQGAERLKRMGADTTNTLEAANALMTGDLDLLSLQKQVAATDPDVWNNYKSFLDSQKGEAGSQTANIEDYNFYQKLKKTDPKGAKAFGQDVGLVSKEGRELSSYYQKQLTDYSDKAAEAEELSGRFGVIASDFEKLDPTAGAAGSAREMLKEITGSEDAVSELKRKYLKLRASQVVKNLPPGAASEKDVQLALSGFPKPTANAAAMASFMRGLQKLQDYEAKYNNFKASYLSENATERGMLRAWNESERSEPKQNLQSVSASDLGSLTVEQLNQLLNQGQ